MNGINNAIIEDINFINLFFGFIINLLIITYNVPRGA